MSNADRSKLAPTAHIAPFAKVASFVLGGAVQVSFFMVFFSVDYFHFFFAPLQPEFYLSFSVSVMSLIGVLVTLIRPFVVSYRFTLNVCFIVSAVAIILVPIFVQLAVNGALNINAAFTLIVIDVGLLGFIQSVNGGCLFSYFGFQFDSWAVQVILPSGRHLVRYHSPFLPL